MPIVSGFDKPAEKSVQSQLQGHPGDARRLLLAPPFDIVYAVLGLTRGPSVRVKGAAHSAVPSNQPDFQPEYRGLRAIKEGRFL